MKTRAHEVHSLSSELARLRGLCHPPKTKLRVLFENLESRDNALLSMILSLPFLFFVPIPGLSTVLGICVCVVAYRIAMKLPPWLPEKWLNRDLPTKSVTKFLTGGEKIFSRIEKLIRPRLGFLSHNRTSIFISCFSMIFAGAVLTLPLPPGTNFPPALAVFVLSVGILEEDGVLILLGHFFSALNILMLWGLYTLGIEGIHALLKI
mgnify:CR=1 FL=1